MERRILPLLLCLLALFPAPARASAENAPALPAGDARLDRRVTVARGSIYLGELLETLSAQAGVPLAVEETKGPLDGVQLIAFFRDRPLREVLAGVSALLDHPYHRCEWRAAARPAAGARAGNAATAGYILRHYPSLAEGAAAARRALVERWADDVRATHQIARLPGDQRKARALTRPDLFPRGELASGILDLFARLAPQEVEMLLRGAPHTLSADALTPREREALRFTTPSGPPGHARFFVEWDPRDAAPMLWVSNGGAATGVVGGDGWEDAWLRAQDATWRTWSDPEVQQFVRQKAAGDRRVGAPTPDRKLPQWLRRAAQLQGLHVLADPVHPDQAGLRAELSGWLGASPEQTLFALVAGDLAWKQQGALHLLRDRTALVHPRAHLVPWPLVRALRRAADRNDGYLDIPELLQLAALNPQQLAALAPEFPDASWRSLRLWQPLLRFYLNLDGAAQERVRGPEGLPIRDAGLVARAALEDPPPARPSGAPAADPAGGSVDDLRRLDLLRRHFPVASVALRVERGKQRIAEGGGASREVEVRRLVWEVRVPERSPWRVSLRLRPRIPVEREERPAADAGGRPGSARGPIEP